MILGQRHISQDELLVRNLSPSVRITAAFAGIYNDVAHVLIIHIATRKDD
jgi:hypothetical protein